MRIIGITLYKLQSHPNLQLCFYQNEIENGQNICAAIDEINLRFGARTIHSARSMGTNHIKTKIPFGSVRYLDHSIN